VSDSADRVESMNAVQPAPGGSADSLTNRGVVRRRFLFWSPVGARNLSGVSDASRHFYIEIPIHCGQSPNAATRQGKSNRRSLESLRGLCHISAFDRGTMLESPD